MRRRGVALVLGLCAAVALLLQTRSSRSGYAKDARGRTHIITSLEVPELELHIIDVGAVVQRLFVQDKYGKRRDVALGFDSIAPYQDGRSPYFGAVVGRVANRIRGAKFELDGKTFHVSANDGNNSLHGGVKGWSRHTWSPLSSPEGLLALQLVSPDGDEGYPGEVTGQVTYTLARGPGKAVDVHILFEAVTTAPSPLNMAQHCYFNLGGTSSPSTVLDHRITINATHYTPVDPQVIPTGEVRPVAGTPFDFTKEHAIGSRIGQITTPAPGGYDTNFVLWGLDGPAAAKATRNCVVADEPELAASIHDPESGIALDVLTNAPGLQFYSGGYLDGSLKGKGGIAYPQHGAFALETQVFPNSINTPSFPQCVLRPGMRYKHKAIWRFSTK